MQIPLCSSISVVFRSPAELHDCHLLGLQLENSFSFSGKFEPVGPIFIVSNDGELKHKAISMPYTLLLKIFLELLESTGDYMTNMYKIEIKSKVQMNPYSSTLLGELLHDHMQIEAYTNKIKY